MIRIALADDHAIVRDGLRRILEREPNMRVVAEAADGTELLQKLATLGCDVVVLDLQMPGMGGLETLRALREKHSKIAVLVLSMYAEDRAAARLLKLGASGYLAKGRSSDQLVVAVNKIAGGGRHVTDLVAEHLLDATEAPPHERLTAREHQVFVAISHGKSPSEIARELGVGASTVSTYLARIKKQLGVQNVGEILLYATRHGLSK